MYRKNAPEKCSRACFEILAGEERLFTLLGSSVLVFSRPPLRQSCLFANLTTWKPWRGRQNRLKSRQIIYFKLRDLERVMWPLLPLNSTSEIQVNNNTFSEGKLWKFLLPYFIYSLMSDIFLVAGDIIKNQRDSILDPWVLLWRWHVWQVFESMRKFQTVIHAMTI